VTLANAWTAATWPTSRGGSRPRSSRIRGDFAQHLDYVVAMASKGRPYRTFVFEGFEILVGRGEDDNDRLTFDVAAPADLWLHVGDGTPGSHVVVRSRPEVQKGAYPKSVVERAAALAAWYSKARDARTVDVHYCKASQVSKPRGAPAGLVELATYDNVRVKPAPFEGGD
jgi:predicted ribosome quality control (RQC) complex YloA/Tae2 family protein